VTASESRPRRKRLTVEDEEVWSAVTRTLKPLKPARIHVAEKPRVVAEVIKVETPRRRLAHAPPTYVPDLCRKPSAPRIQPIEDKLKRKLARGSLRADMKLDLHGMRQHEAHDALYSFIGRARGAGARIVIVVTGKGRGSRSDDGHGHGGGILQRMVRHWLAAPELRDRVIGFDEADAAHGGAGALYVRIRRDRSATGRDE
jgi:DNA-nicking Smr family endonuclease